MDVQEDLDLRPYVDVLLRRWWQILVIAAVAAGLLFGASQLLAPTYRATALVTITDSRTVVQFDPRIQTIADRQPLRAYPELARSDAMLQTLIAQNGALPDDMRTVEGLRDRLIAEAGNDLSLLRLSVTHENPETAARVANAWASLFVAWANDVYRPANAEQVDFYRAQLADADTTLAGAEAALIAFQERNRSAIGQNELDVQLEAQALYLSERRDLNNLVRDVSGLLEQMRRRQGSDDPTLADQLALIAVQLDAFSTQATLPVTLQLESATFLEGQSRAGLIAQLEDLLASLDTTRRELDGALAALEPRILSLQQETLSAQTEASRLQRDYDIASETVLLLSRKVQEEQIASQEVVTGFRLASQASRPTEAISPRPFLNAVIGGGFALLAAVAGLIALTWWRGAAAASARPSESAEVPA